MSRHLVTIGSRPVQLTCLALVVGLCFLLLPHDVPREGVAAWVPLLHLAAFACYFGTMTWVPFIGGMTLYRAFPRHQFGKVQSANFPSYFLTGGITQVILLLTFLMQHPVNTWASDGLTVAGGTLVVSLATALLNWLYFNPVAITLLAQRNKLESQLPGFGTEVGVDEEKVRELKATSPEYKSVCARFGSVHGYSSLANFVTLAANLVHLYRLASNLTTL